MTTLVDAGYRYGVPVLGATAVGKELTRDARYLGLIPADTLLPRSLRSIAVSRGPANTQAGIPDHGLSCSLSLDAPVVAQR